jgi:predicted nucleic-acid-binding protein
MIAVDTNVLVRLLANDDPIQSRQAAQVFASDDVFIAKSVLLETEWVLRFSYGVPAATILAAFDRLLSSGSVAIEDASAVAAAVAAHRAGMDLADALHVASSAGAARFVTFDKRLARQAARDKTTVPVAVVS